MLLLNTPSVFAQSGFTLSWDSEVGCLEYSGKRTDPVEDIGDDNCLLTCEGSTVTFTLGFGNESVSSLAWTTDGGQILSTNMGSSEGAAEIEWSNVQEHGNVTVFISLADGTSRTRSVCVTTKPKPQGGFEILGQQNQNFCSENELFFENNAFVPDGSQIVASQNDLYYYTPPGQKPASSENGYAEMSVSPNPVQTGTEVRYSVQDISDFKEGALELYSLSGNLIKTKRVNQPTGIERFDLSGLASGSYVLVFYLQGQRIGQQILIKK